MPLMLTVVSVQAQNQKEMKGSNIKAQELVLTQECKSGKTKRATLQKRRVSKSTKTTRTRKTVSPVLSCMTRAHRFLFV